MHTAAPYREPCTGWGRPTYRGGCFQHYRTREAAFPVVENITQVADYQCPDEAPATRAPYSRPFEGTNCGGAYDPMPGEEWYCETYFWGNVKPPCGTWAKSEFLPCGGGVPKSSDERIDQATKRIDRDDDRIDGGVETSPAVPGLAGDGTRLDRDGRRIDQ